MTLHEYLLATCIPTASTRFFTDFYINYLHGDIKEQLETCKIENQRIIL